MKKLINTSSINENSFEKDFCLLLRDNLKVKISYDTFLNMQNFYKNHKASETTEKFFNIINKFPKLDHTGLGGSITDNDITASVKAICDNFAEINLIFSEVIPRKQGLLIVTDTAGSWHTIFPDLGVFVQK